MAKMVDRYGQELNIDDRVIVATLAGKSANLREARIVKFKNHQGAISAGVRTEAGGSTTVRSARIVLLPKGTPERTA